MKHLIAYIFLMLLPVMSLAGERERTFKRLTYGAELGYVYTFYSGYHNNFFSPDGWRVNEQDHGPCSENNAEMFLHIGWNLTPKWNLSAYSGYTSIRTASHCIPVSVRATRYFKESPKGDRWLSFIDLGSGISIKKRPQEILTGKIGTGYRISLSEGTKLDILASVRMNYIHSDIIFENIQIDPDRINRNNSYGYAAAVGISLSF